MDEVVRQAMQKWPNVPHCYGWLALDARGNWRMRDERAQTLGMPGDKIAHTALLSFINRNYACDELQRWYFQNGPQRVYVDIELTPCIARTDPTHGFLLHTGVPLPALSAVYLTDNGRLLLVADTLVAAVDDRDMAGCLAALHINGSNAGDEQLLAWMADPVAAGTALTWRHAGQEIPVQHLRDDEITRQFQFVTQPRAA
ncbi:DUF2946 family protein [Herbaspirillum autotrophicum]|uniref:DUF2946 family protein n=1 Tax=Herbaspirillum autotrophicum TaxID=180195 RepID=UPI00067D9296|nr:DUF2946 family protein [Herbaspirillum autotrophicum]